jgi:hypothetical protein
MAQLILCDAEGHEIGRREMASSERLAYYEAWNRHDLIAFNGKQYLIQTVAWLIQDEQCICRVTDEGYLSGDC